MKAAGPRRPLPDVALVEHSDGESLRERQRRRQAADAAPAMMTLREDVTIDVSFAAGLAVPVRIDSALPVLWRHRGLDPIGAKIRSDVPDAVQRAIAKRCTLIQDRREGGVTVPGLAHHSASPMLRSARDTLILAPTRGSIDRSVKCATLWSSHPPAQAVAPHAGRGWDRAEQRGA